MAEELAAEAGEFFYGVGGVAGEGGGLRVGVRVISVWAGYDEGRGLSRVDYFGV